MINDRYILDYANQRLDIIQKSNNHLKISFHDWEDFRQETLIHLFQKKDQWIAGSGYKAWIKTIIQNQFLNFLRKRFIWHNNKNQNRRLAKLQLKNPDTFVTKLLTVDSVGNKHWEIFPDMIQEEENKDLKEIIDELEPFKKQFIQDYLKDKNWKLLAKKYNWHYLRTYKFGQEILAEIKQQF